jgi:hypothetical protein
MESLPPGVSTDGITDEQALFAAHRDGVTSAGTSFRVDVRNATETLVTVDRVNDTTARRIDLRSRTGAGLSYYFADPVYATYNHTDDSVGYARGDVPLAGDAILIDIAITGLGTSWLRAVEWESAGVESVAGEQRLVLNGSGLDRSEARSGGTLLPPLVDDGDSIQSVDARMTVTGDGLIRHANVTVTGETNGTAARTTLVLSTESSAGDVSEPSWLADAPRVELDADADGRLLAVDHTGGPAVDAGTELSVTADGDPVGNVTLPTSVETGDTVYVHRTVGEGLAVSVNDRPTVPDGVTAFSGQVLVTGSQGQITFRAGVDRSAE